MFCFTPLAAEGLPHMQCGLHAAEVEDPGNAKPHDDNTAPSKTVMLQEFYCTDKGSSRH